MSDRVSAASRPAPSREAPKRSYTAALTYAATKAREAQDELRAAVGDAVHEGGLSVAEVAVATALSRARVEAVLAEPAESLSVERQMTDGTMTYRVHGVLAPMSGFRLVDGNGRVWAAQFNSAPAARAIDVRYPGLAPELSLTEYR